MFPNLNAEQARLNLCDDTLAMEMGITRKTFCKKKKTGKFVLGEINYLLDRFDSSYEYLFAKAPLAQKLAD